MFFECLLDALDIIRIFFSCSRCSRYSQDVHRMISRYLTDTLVGLADLVGLVCPVGLVGLVSGSCGLCGSCESR